MVLSRRMAAASGLLALALTGCIGGAETSPAADAGSLPPSSGPLPGTCDRQQVPGHEGREVRTAGGLDCAAARQVILEAVGKGRAAYEADGLACTPADAPDGQTDYVCTRAGEPALTFRYGAN